MLNDTPRRIEDEKTQPLGPRPQQLRRQRDPLQRRQHVVRDHRQPQPRRIRAKVLARHHASGQFVLQHIVHRFNRSRLLLMPLDQLLRRSLPNIARHGKMFLPATVSKQFLLPRTNANLSTVDRTGYSATRRTV